MYYLYKGNKYSDLKEFLNETIKAINVGTDATGEFYQEFADYKSEEINDRKMLELRQQRENECFSVVNRGKVWYDTLTDEQYAELIEWYNAWLNVTKSRAGAPSKPTWLK